MERTREHLQRDRASRSKTRAQIATAKSAFLIFTSAGAEGIKTK